MFSKLELDAILTDATHVLTSVSLDDKQEKTRKSIVEKISSHNTSSPKLPDKAKVVDAADGIFPYRHLRIDELTVLSWTYEVMAGKIGL